MAYLGNAPARSFISFERQVFTIVNSQTAYTLDHSVNNENDLRLVINNVVQEPGTGKAYTASGTTLTLSAALTNGTDEMYCVFLGRAVATNKPGAGSVGTTELASDAVTTAKITDLNVTTAKIAADAITEAKIADSAVENEHLNVNVITGQTAETSIATDDTILIHDTSASALRKMTRANFVSGLGGMVLLDTQSVTSGTIANIQTGAIFSATYNSYRIMFDQFKFTSPSALYFQLATSSGVVTGYQRNTIGLRGSNTQDDYDSSDSSIKLFGNDNSNNYKSNSNQGMPSGYIDVFNPYTAGNTHILSKLNFGNATDNAAQQAHTLAIKIDTTSYDRFKIGLSNGSIGATTKVRTYGFNI